MIFRGPLEHLLKLTIFTIFTFLSNTMLKMLNVSPPQFIGQRQHSFNPPQLLVSVQLRLHDVRSGLISTLDFKTLAGTHFIPGNWQTEAWDREQPEELGATWPRHDCLVCGRRFRTGYGAAKSSKRADEVNSQR